MKAKTQKSEVKSKAAPQTMDELLAATGYKLKGFKRGETVTGKVVDVSGRTVFIDVGGKAEGVLADTEYEMSKDYIKGLKPGDEVTGVVISPENEIGQIVLSLRKAAADSRWKLFEQAFTEGTILTAQGKEVNKGGLLVEIEGIYGFIPASQFSKEMAGNVDNLVGEPVQVRVIEVDRVQSRLVLSEKAVSEAGEIEARKKALVKVKVGGEYEGKIVGLVPFGVFVEIEVVKGQKLEGLVHISEISWEKVDDVSGVFKEGDMVEVQVIGVDESAGKLALSVKRLSDDPWKEIAKDYPVDSKHTGKVVKVAPYGVFVHLKKGIEGLIHASKMPSDRGFAEGEEVEVFVESVDLDKRRLSLGVVEKDTKGMIYK